MESAEGGRPPISDNVAKSLKERILTILSVAKKLPKSEVKFLRKRVGEDRELHQADGFVGDEKPFEGNTTR